MEDRKKLIAELVEASEKRQDSKSGSRAIEIAGQIQRLESYRLPIDELKYNIKNGRFAAELIAKEKELGRTLDPLKRKDAEEIKQLLLEQEKEKTESLKADLMRHGQLEPGLITDEGFVINGNKRMAIFEELRSKSGDDRFDYMEFMLLPKGASPKELWRIEAGLQLSDEKRIAYGPINELLKIRQGIEVGLEVNQIAGSIYGLKPSDVKERLAWLQIVEDYLAHTGNEGRYKEVEGSFEHIKSLYNNIKGLKKRDIKGEELSEFILIEFEAIKVNASNTQVRKIGEAKREKFKRAWSTIRDAYKKRNLTLETVEDAVDLIKSEKDIKKPQKLVIKIIELLQMLSEIPDDELAFIISRGDLQTAKEYIDKLTLRCKKAGAKKKQNLDKLKTKYRDC